MNPVPVPPVGLDADDRRLLGVLVASADAVTAVLADHDDWGPSGHRAGQYASDLAADAAALAPLLDAGLGVLSEEAGELHADRPLVAVVDPLDGSTNASLGLPWYATSLCVVDEGGPRVALVRNQASGETYTAVRGAGATRDDVPLHRDGAPSLGEAIVALADLPPHRLGWGQFRCYGAAALDLCAVADGRFDAYIDCGADAHGVWDYLGAVLVCREAGVPVVDAWGRDLCVLDHEARRTPVAAGDEALLAELLEQRRSF